MTEQDFLKLCCNLVGRAGEVGVFPRDIIYEPGFPVPPKRALYWLEKWSDKDWYNYGVSLDMGWMEDAAYEHLKTISTPSHDT